MSSFCSHGNGEVVLVTGSVAAMVVTKVVWWNEGEGKNGGGEEAMAVKTSASEDNSKWWCNIGYEEVSGECNDGT